MAEFIECSSLNVSYNSMGVATVSYTVVHNNPGFVTYDTIEAGGRTFTGYVMNANMNPIPNTTWYETHVTLVATTN